MIKLKPWRGEAYTTASLKIDGIQVHLSDGKVLSRSGKSLHNIDPSLLEENKIYECFLGDFQTTVSVLRSFNSDRKVTKDELYEIYPGIDPRLVTTMSLSEALAAGYEGLVLDRKYKAKAKHTLDVPIIDIIPGKGKHEGKMGALLTYCGKVGTGFTDKERSREWQIGEIIEVEFMEMTPDGKFRHPRFVRDRWDK